jgi:hypothetical protein
MVLKLSIKAKEIHKTDHHLRMPWADDSGSTVGFSAPGQS